MKHRIILLNILTILLLFSCARIREFNKENVYIIESESKSNMRFKKIRIQLNDDKIIESKNVHVVVDSSSMRLYNESTSLSYSIIDIQTVEYSNTNLGGLFGLMGWVAGICYALRDDGNNGDSVGIGSPASLFYPALTSLAGFTIGNLIGRYIYVNWQEYDITAYRSYSYNNPYYFPGTSVPGISIIIPF